MSNYVALIAVFAVPFLADANTPHTIALEAQPASVSLIIDGTTVATTPVASISPISRLTVGSPGVSAAGFYSSWQGTLSKFAFYDYAIPPSLTQ